MVSEFQSKTFNHNFVLTEATLKILDADDR